jgi:hypothetical protein
MKVTYQAIIDFVMNKHGKKMQTCWIAHAKEINGLPLITNNDRQKGQLRVKPCPDKQLKWIEEAFKHFNMIK